MGFRWRFYSRISHLANTGHSRSLGDHVWRKMFDVDIDGNTWKYMFFFDSSWPVRVILIQVWVVFCASLCGWLHAGDYGSFGGIGGSKVAHVSFQEAALTSMFFIRNGCLCHKHMIRMNCSPLLWLMMMWLRIHHSKVCILSFHKVNFDDV